VIDHYDRGGAVRRKSISPAVFPLHLTEEEKADLLTFLDTLNGPEQPVTLPALPR